MRDGIILTVADDGTARVYYDTYDIVIHCESQEWRDKVKERIMGIKPKTAGSGFNHGEKDENWEARTTAEPSASDCWSNDNKTTNDSIVTKSSRYSTDRTTDGLISRQDAIKEAYPVSIDGEVFDVVQVETLMGLPPAQPETIIESDESIKLQNSNDTISRQAAIDAINRAVTKEAARWSVEGLSSAQPARVWTPCDIPPEHHRDVIVRGVEAIGNVTVHNIMQWDVDKWRPENYAPSITWLDWSEI